MNICKTLILAAGAVLLLASCGIAAGNATVDEKMKALVETAVTEHMFTIEVDKVNPVGFSSITSTNGYRLRVKDGKVNASLQYFGRGTADSAYSNEPAGIVFNEYPIEIQSPNSGKKDRTVMKFTAKTGTESVNVTVTIWNNGSAEINCICSKRSPISYLGHLVENSDPE